MTDPTSPGKARGAFFTPVAIAAYLAAWAIRAPTDNVFEPSCGEASFLLTAGERLRALGAPPAGLTAQLQGVEIHRASARQAAVLLAGRGLRAGIEVGDFFDRTPAAEFDAVIGNPPYVRYQSFAGEARARAQRAALAAGVRLTGLSSSWAAFTIHASRFLRPDGRLALVLPGELLTVNYAAEVRRFLLRRFARVRLVLFDTRVFPGVLEEVVLLLAEGQGGAPYFELFQAGGPDSLPAQDALAWTEHRPEDGKKWTPALIAADAFSLYRSLAEGPGFADLLDWGETWLGAVTGNNAWFAMGRAEAARLGLTGDGLLPISPPGSRHLRGLAFDRRAWEKLAGEGAACFLFDPADTSAAAVRRHIEAGRQQRVHTAYKCRMRSPWWHVPVGKVPDLLLTYMNQDRPRLLANSARVHVLNSVYGVSLRPGLRWLGRALLPLAFLNSFTLLGAEMVGRSYGGGLLKLEPREADSLPVPSPATLRDAAPALRAVRSAVEAALRVGDVAGATALVDGVLLSGQLGLPSEQTTALRLARDLLSQRRRARGRRHAGS
jgi:adenine-specific DNA-methyltransferase